jgi:hypothetical protein
MRALAAALALALLAATAGPWAPPGAAAEEPRLVDAALASVRGALVTLSDVALARALGLFGLGRSDGPITPAEVTRYVNAKLAVREADQLAVKVSAEDVARAWEAAGGAALGPRLEAAGIDPAWARRMMEDDLQIRRFVELRFQAFAFVTEAEVDEALGPGAHDGATRRAARERLRDERAAKALAEWTDEARGRARIRVLAAGPWPAPFSLGPGR